MPLEDSHGDLARFLDALDHALQAAAYRAVDNVAAGAVEHLSSFETLEQHFALAELWTHETVGTDDGAMATVWSSAEDMVFLNKTSSGHNARVRSEHYLIEGHRLLAILEGGARRHPIIAGTVTDAETPLLTIPVLATKTWVKVMGQPSDVVGTARVTSVDHPGVKGDNNVGLAADEIVESADAIAFDLSAMVSAELDYLL